jgi:hypothetical protein
MKETAVEFLLSKTSKHCFNKKEIEQAKAMEKEQIIEAHISSRDPYGLSMGNAHSCKKAEQYYKETFKTE